MKMFKSSCSAMFKLKFSCLAIGFSFSSFFLTPSQTESQLKFGNANFRYLRLLALGGPNGEKLAPTCGQILSSIKVNRSQRKSSQVHASHGQMESQVIAWLASSSLSSTLSIHFDLVNSL